MGRLASRLLLAVALLAALPGVASAQRRDRDRPPADQPPTVPAAGTEVFRALFHIAKVQPVTMVELADLQNPRAVGPDAYRGLIVVILGNPNTPTSQFLNELNLAPKVLAGGGAVLIASDSRLELLTPRETVGGHIDGAPVTSATSFHRLHECPLVVPTEPGPLNFLQPDPVWKVFGDSAKIATNGPSFLTPPEGGRFAGEFRNVLARFPAGSQLTRDQRNQTLPRNHAFAVGGSGTGQNPYRCLAMADQSVFINLMLLEPNTDNLEFAQRVVVYLQDSGGVNRRRCAFFENGRLVERFDSELIRYALRPPPTPIPMPSFQKVQEFLVDQGNRLIDRAQENDVVNSLLLGPPSNPGRREQSLRAWLATFLVMASVYAVLYALRRVWKSRQPGDTPPPPATGRPGKAGAAEAVGGVFARRQRELLRRNNLYEPVRELVRAMFESVGAPADAGPRLPPVKISREVRKPQSLMRALADLWRIAHGPPQVVTVQKWDALGPVFERVRQAHADGKWQFLGPETTA